VATFYTYEASSYSERESPDDEFTLTPLAATERHAAWAEARERFLASLPRYVPPWRDGSREEVLVVLERIGAVGLDDSMRAEWEKRIETETERRAKFDEARERAEWERLNQKFGGR